MTARPRLLFYCQHSVGLGHLVRSFALCRSLAEHFEVVLLCGGALPEAIEVPPGVRLISLPPLGVDANGSFGSHDPNLTVERARQLRREMLVAAVREQRPAVVLIELFPFGRAKFANELEPFLAAAHELDPRPLVACSLRDILVRGRGNQAEFDERAASIANRWFDAILMHAEERLAPLEESFRPREPLTVPVHYTGYVLPHGHRPAPPAAERQRRVVVSAGGGLVGAPLLHAGLDAHRLLWDARKLRTTLIAGPFLPDDAFAALRAEADGVEGLDLLRSVPDLTDELRTAAASVSQCGYNTTLELLHSGVPAVVVPYAPPEEDEQTRRAARLAAMGALRVLDSCSLSGAALAAEIVALLSFTPQRAVIDLDGARRSASLLADLAGEGEIRAGARVVA